MEATKFTEVGYVGRDVEQIIRDLVEIGIALIRDKKRLEVQAKAHQLAEERVLDALVGATASPATRDSFRKKLRNGELDDKEIDIEVADSGSGAPGFDSSRHARLPISASSTCRKCSARPWATVPRRSGPPSRHPMPT